MRRYVLKGQTIPPYSQAQKDALRLCDIRMLILSINEEMIPQGTHRAKRRLREDLEDKIYIPLQHSTDSLY